MKSAPSHGSGKKQIMGGGQTKGRFASDPNVKLKGEEGGEDDRVKIKG